MELASFFNARGRKKHFKKDRETSAYRGKLAPFANKQQQNDASVDASSILG